MSEEFYVGPAFLLKKQFKDIKLVVHTCTKPKCPVHKKDKNVRGNFCAECGSPIADQDRQQKIELFNIYSYVQYCSELKEIEELLAPLEGSDYHLPNYYNGLLNGETIVINLDTIQQEFDDFKNLPQTKKIIELITKHYGDDAIRIDYIKGVFWF